MNPGQSIPREPVGSRRIALRDPYLRSAGHSAWSGLEDEEASIARPDAVAFRRIGRHPGLRMRGAVHSGNFPPPGCLGLGIHDVEPKPPVQGVPARKLRYTGEMPLQHFRWLPWFEDRQGIAAAQGESDAAGGIPSPYPRMGPSHYWDRAQGK